MTEQHESDCSGPDRPDTLECPSCGEPTDRRVTSAGVRFICTNPECDALLYRSDLVSGQPVSDDR